MYYDNKSTFYIKEYGPSVIIVVASILLISSGAFIYYNTTIKPNQPPVVAESDTEENNSLVNVEKNEENKEVVKEENKEVTKVKDNTYFINLPLLTKSSEVTVKSVSDDIKITVENDDSKLDFKLIGVDTSYNTGALKKEIETNLVGKKVKVAFDKLKKEDDCYKAYIFLDKELYNANLLKNGTTTLLSERNNYSLNNKLAEAQKYARSKSLGVWKK